MSIVIVAAAKFEIDPLLTAFKQIGVDVEYQLVGIGAINSAKNAKAIADSCRKKSVIFIGTCGTFASFSEIQLIRANTVHWSPACERLGLGYTVRDTAPTITLPQPPTWVCSLPVREVLCSPTISLTDKLPNSISPDISVENLELYSCIDEIATSCDQLAVILAITNQIGPDSHIQWRQHFEAAAQRASDFVIGNFN